MIRHLKSVTLLIFALPFLYSCEEPIDFLEEQEARLVIISNFTNDNDLQVIVSKTKSVLSTESSTYLTDATVMVFAGNELLEILDLVEANEEKRIPPYYRSKEMKPVAGEIYTIKVSAPGFNSITATNSIPDAVQIQSVNFENTVGQNANFITQVNFDVSVTFADPSHVQNYYHLVFYQELIPYHLSAEGDTIKGESQLTTPIVALPKDPNLPLISYFDNRSFLLKDNTFNGQTISLPFAGSYTFSKQLFLPGDFFVELRTVSEAYYLYHSTLTRQINSNHPLSEGVVIYDNIENGEGIFAGYSSTFNSFRLNN